MLFCSACEEPEDHSSYSYQLDRFLKTLEVDSAELVAYDKLTGLRDSLLGKHFRDVKLLSNSGREVSISSLEGPVLIETFASWCSPCVSSIPALNSMAEKYQDQINFILITQETQNEFDATKFGIANNIKLMHANNEFKPGNIIYLKSGTMKSVLPFPTTYFLDDKKTIRNINIGAPRVGTYGGTTYSKKEVTKMNIARIEAEILEIISNQ